MNVANLRIEGLLMAVASINQTLVAKGVLSIDDIALALRKAEAALTSEERVFEAMSPANRDAICFPIRLLRAANEGQLMGSVPAFSDLARQVGETKERHNDQR